MSGSLHPALILVAGALVLPLLRGPWRGAATVVLPLAGFLNLLGLEAGTELRLDLAGFELHVLRVDRLSLIFGYLFHLAALVGAVYALHLKDWLQPTTGLVYAGSAVGAVFAGDLVTLFLFWELLAVTSVFQIWARGTERALGAGMRYLLVHVTSGLLLLAGAALRHHETGSLAFGPMELQGLASWLLLLAIGVKCAFPLLHTWLVDAYPEATPTGTVFLSAFTTKAAVYCLARGFAGAEVLIWIGAAMTLFPIFFAVIENDLRRVLGYSMINQIGFMVVGVGLGEGLGVNGAVAHAFNDVFFKGLLFMSMGAVLLRTGRMNGSDLGGLYKSMPWTAGFCIVGASSISAFPLFSGFVSKSMVMAEAAHQGQVVLWLMLLFASAGVFHHAGIKIPFFAFFSHDAGIRCREAPPNMLIAMGLGAAVCLFNGIWPGTLYGLLPYPVVFSDGTAYHPFEPGHVLHQLQLLFFSALAFAALKLTHLYPPELRSVNLDVDWLGRTLLPRGIEGLRALAAPLAAGLSDAGRGLAAWTIDFLHAHHGPAAWAGRTWLTSTSVLVVVGALAAYLLFVYRTL